MSGISIATRDFGAMPDGRMVQAVTLTAGPVSFTVLTLGGILQSALLPDRNGVPGEVTLGYDSVAAHLAGRAYLGAIIGRTTGRIAGGRVSVDGIGYQLSCNEHGNTLHGGTRGFDRALWQLVSAQVEDGAAVLRLVHTSPAGDQGYPGAVTVDAVYRLDACGFELRLTATSDAPTLVNLTWHPYWNLSGGVAPVGDHVMQLAASRYYPSGAARLTQAATAVAGGVFDLRTPRELAALFASDDPQALAAGGIDHVFVADAAPVVARLTHPASGRSLAVSSAAPALVVYTGAGLAGGPAGHGGQVIGPHAGIAIEPQALPDADMVLRPGTVWRWNMVLAFSAEA